MKNAARAVAVRMAVVGGMTGVTVLMGTGVAMAAATYPPAPPTTTQTAVAPAVTPVAVLGEVVTKPAPAAVAPSASLPFTGLDTMALVAVGAALVAGGAAMTVATRRRRGVQH